MIEMKAQYLKQQAQLQRKREDEQRRRDSKVNHELFDGRPIEEQRAVQRRLDHEAFLAQKRQDKEPKAHHQAKRIKQQKNFTRQVEAYL